MVWARFWKAPTAREAALAFLQDSTVAMTGGDCDLPHGWMATLASVGSEGHADLGELMRTTRAGGFDLLKARFDRAKVDGDLPATADTIKLARFVQTVQSGMAIRARDGADRPARAIEHDPPCATAPPQQCATVSMKPLALNLAGAV